MWFCGVTLFGELNAAAQSNHTIRHRSRLDPRDEEEYRLAREHRFAAAATNAVIVAGFESPQR
jgi:hypothetical protein